MQDHRTAPVVVGDFIEVSKGVADIFWRCSYAGQNHSAIADCTSPFGRETNANAGSDFAEEGQVVIGNVKVILAAVVRVGRWSSIIQRRVLSVRPQPSQQPRAIVVQTDLAAAVDIGTATDAVVSPATQLETEQVVRRVDDVVQVIRRSIDDTISEAGGILQIVSKMEIAEAAQPSQA